MCGLAGASLATQAFGVGMSTVGSIFAASSRKSALRFQARMAEIDAKIADMNAENTLRAGQTEESRVKLRGALEKGAVTARMAASGIDMANSPTAIARLTAQDLFTEEDAKTVRLNSLRAAWGHRFKAGDARNRATMARAEASSISPFMSGFTSLVGGAGQLASSWYSMSEAGAFGTPGNDNGGSKPRWGEPGHEDNKWPFGENGGFGWGGL